MAPELYQRKKEQNLSAIDALTYRQQLLFSIDSRGSQALTVHHSSSLNMIPSWLMTKLPAMFAICERQHGMYEIRWMVTLTVLWSWDAKTHEGWLSPAAHTVLIRTVWNHTRAAGKGNQQLKWNKESYKALDFSLPGYISGTKYSGSVISWSLMAYICTGGEILYSGVFFWLYKSGWSAEDFHAQGCHSNKWQKYSLLYTKKCHARVSRWCATNSFFTPGAAYSARLLVSSLATPF